MSEKTRTELKTYFESNDWPTQAQFINLIDSLINKKDDGVLVGGESSITAYSGGGQESAYQLTKKVNHIATSAAPGDSVKLSIGIAGMVCVIWQKGANAVDVYPSAGGQIDLAGINAAKSQANATVYIYNCYSSDLWYTIQYP